MPIVIKSNNGVTICNLAGEININSSPKIKKVLTKLIAKKTTKITIDLSRVTYIDSSGLAMLIEMLKNTKLSGGSLELSSLTPRIKNIFEIKKLDRLFDIIS
ncbi:MAG: STAS domain-containing protein [Candidatus Omnitrophota bacterium]|nr:STAS domain-containing protein [Candidatus Omnitrophota bacterium]